MFEQVVANIINKVLGDYIVGLQTSQLNIGVWAGDVVLKNLQLNKNALNALNLPVDIVCGYIGGFVMKIPWHNLKGMPFKIAIEDVLLVVSPKSTSVFVLKEEKEMLFERKMGKLKIIESAHQVTDNDSSYTSQLINKIIDNMQISIGNIHVRYQDSLSNPNHNFSLGFTLSELSILSVNADWEVQPVVESKETRKLLSLSSLSVYWDDSLITETTLDELRAKMHAVPKSYLLKPVTGHGKLTINKKYGLNIPKYDIVFEFDEFSLALSQSQFENLWFIINHFENNIKAAPYLHLHDLKRTSMWKFAISAVLQDVRKKLRPLTLEFILKRRKTKLEYVRNFVLKKLGTITPVDQLVLDALERKLSLDDLIIFRQFANIALRQELKKKKETRQKEPPAQTSWSSWFWGAEPQEMDRLLDYDEMLVKEEAALPPDCLLSRIRFRLGTACLFLQKSPQGVPCYDPQNPLIPNTFTCAFEKFSFDFFNNLDNSFSVSLDIQNFRSFDSLSPQNQEIIYSTKRTKQPFFTLSFASGKTNRLGVESQSLTILWPRQTVDALTRFFTLPEIFLESYQSVATSIKNQTKASLEYALSKHKKTDILVNIAAPLFIFPLPNGEHVLVDSGNLTINSELADTNEIQSQLKEANIEQIITLMYDRYRVALNKLRIVTANTVNDCINALNDKIDYIVDDMDVEFILETSILPDAFNLAKIKLSGSLPHLTLNLSPKKYKNIMFAFDIISATFSNEKETIVESPRNVKQELIDLQFKFALVQVHMSNESEVQIAVLSFGNLSILLKQHTNDRHLYLQLQDVSLVDAQQDIPELQQLISSKESGKQVVEIEFHNILNNNIHETRVIVSCDAVTCLTTRKSILELLSLCKFSSGPKVDTMHFTLKTNKIKINFNQDDEIFASASLLNSEFILDSDFSGIVGLLQLNIGTHEIIKGEHAKFKYTDLLLFNSCGLKLNYRPDLIFPFLNYLFNFMPMPKSESNLLYNISIESLLVFHDGVNILVEKMNATNINVNTVELSLVIDANEEEITRMCFNIIIIESHVKVVLKDTILTLSRTQYLLLMSKLSLLSSNNNGNSTFDYSITCNHVSLLLKDTEPVARVELHGIFCNYFIRMEFGIHKFSIVDVRNKNHFTEIMTGVEMDEYAYQVLCHYSTMYTLVIDSPKVLVIFDFISDLMDIFKSNGSSNMQFQLKIVNAEAILLHDAKSPSSSALCCTFRELRIWKDSLGGMISNFGVFLGQMDSKDRTRILQDFDCTIATESLESIVCNIGAVLLRLSYQEVLFIRALTEQLNFKGESEFKVPQTSIAVNIDSLRVILIDDLHNLHVPMFDFVSKIEITVGKLSFIDLKFHLKMWNQLNSAWEPAIEPSHIKIEANQEFDLKINAKTEHLMNINITRQMLENLINTREQWPESIETRRIRERKPYMVRNRCGHEVIVCASKTNFTVKNNESQHFCFEWDDRESTTINVHVHGNPWETVDVHIGRQQTVLCALRPPIKGVLYFMCVETSVFEKVKIITLKSPYMLSNRTPLKINVCADSSIVTVLPNDEYIIPIGLMYTQTMRIRPDAQYKYAWSQSILLSHFKETLLLSCASPDGSPSFRMLAHVDKSIEVKRSGCEFTRIAIYPPLQVANCLPFDIIYQILDRNRSCPLVSEGLSAGAVSSASTLDLAQSLGIQVKIPALDLTTVEVGIIQNNESDNILLSNDMKLRIIVQEIENTGGSRRVSIYSRFVVFNRLAHSMHLQLPQMVTVPPMCIDLLSESKVSVYLYRSRWSKMFDLDALSGPTQLVLCGEEENVEFYIGVSVQSGCGHPGASRLVSFCPRFILTNLCEETIQWKQQKQSNVRKIDAKCQHGLEWLVCDDVQAVCFGFAHSGLAWSTGVNIRELGTTFLRMDALKNNDLESRLLEAEVVLLDAIIYIFIRRSVSWPFRIQNLTETQVTFYQSPNLVHRTVESGRTALYAWDDPIDPDKTLTLVILDKTRVVNFFEIGTLEPIGQHALDIYVDGSTRVLSVSPYEAKCVASTSSLNVLHTASKVAITIALDLGISLCNEHEILYISLKDLVLSYQDTSLYKTWSIKLHWLQIDNQNIATPDPIVLFPTRISKDSDSDCHALQIVLVKSKDQSRGLQYFKHFVCLLQELTLSVDQTLLETISDFFTFAQKEEHNDWNSKLNTTAPLPKDSSAQLYFEFFEIQPLKFNISFATSQSQSSQNVVSFVARILSMGLGNVHDFPLKLNSLTLVHPIGSFDAIYDAIYTHYSNQVWSNGYKVVGSMDLIGNPVGLFQNLASGVHSIFYEPLQGIISDRPQDLGIGLAKGTAAFVGKAVYGVADSFTKISGALGKGLATATMDERFQQARIVSRRRNRPKHAFSGVTTGAKSLAKGFISAISGVVTQPLEGAEKSGVEGFFKGLGKGIVGLGAKPIVGLLDLASNISEGIKNTTTVFEDEAEIERVRLPRFIDHYLSEYSAHDALGQYYLWQTDNGAYAEKHYVAHLQFDEFVTILCTDAILHVKLLKLKTDWVLSYCEVSKLAQMGISIKILLVKRGLREVFGPDKAAVQMFASQIDIRLKQYSIDNKPIE